ncbi:hypothetical protein Ancab_002254 [Ancistrocladus abbreviatus]
MMRKRTRSIQKEQQMGQITAEGVFESHSESDVLGHKQKTNSFFNVPGLFVGFSTPKSVSDCDSVRSPTSPLDFKLLSNLGNSLRFPKSSNDGNHMKWDCNKVGLGIVDSLDNDFGNLDGEVMRSSNSKNILFGPQIRTKTPKFQTHFNFVETPKSLPKNCAIFPHAQINSSNLQKGKSDVLFEIGDDPLEPITAAKIQSFSLDSKRLGSYIYSLAECRAKSGSAKNSCLENISVRVNPPPKLPLGSPNFENSSHENLSSFPVLMDSGNGYIGSLSASEIELSEDYTRVILHGPNPKTTHIFGDCVLECHPIETSGNKRGGVEIGVPKLGRSSEFPTPYPSVDFLSFCCFCKKKLEEGKDIYMYRGEKAFCSLDCRLEEILIEEGKENSNKKAPKESPKSLNGCENFENGMFDAI